jgi:Domain of unknown function (DUF4337)
MSLDIDTPESKDARLNRAVAITVVILSVFLGLAHVKDDNLVQAMQQAKADAVDTWGEYQATKTKLHITEGQAGDLSVLAAMAKDPAPALKLQAAAQARIQKYRSEVPELMAKAKGLEAEYDRLNIHDDQFDAADALISIAISVAAVAALSESPWVLAIAWAFGGFGMVMGVAGFAGWGLHPDFLSKLLS